MEDNWPAVQALRQLRHEKVRWPFGCLRCIQMHHLFRRNHIAHRLAPAGLVDEHEGIEATILLMGEAVRRRDCGQGRRYRGMTGDELVELRRQNRVQAMEIEILKRASAYFARENVLPK